MAYPQSRPISSLYVGDLPSNITEALLFEKFSHFGKVISIRICRRRDDNQPLGYAYVNYEKDEDAVQAIETLNLTEISGKFIRVMRCQRDPASRKSGKANLFIKNLHPSITDRELFDTFSPFGEIMSCKIARDDMNVNRGYGFVQFMNETSAETAINTLNGKMIHDKIIYVGHFHFRNDSVKNENDTKNEADGDFTNCFVKNLSEDETDVSLGELFSKFGDIQSAKVMRDEEFRSKGYAFVNFTTHSAAVSAVSEMNGKVHKDRVLLVSRAQTKAERQTDGFKVLKSDSSPDKNFNREISTFNSAPKNLYLKNLHDAVDDERLRQEFTAFGVITSAKVMLDSSGRSKGFGFVSFKTSQSAIRAMEEKGGKALEGKPLYISFAQKKEDRKKILTKQYHDRIRQIHTQTPPHATLTQLAPPGIICTQYHNPNGIPTRPPHLADVRPLFYPPGSIPMTHVRPVVPANVAHTIPDHAVINRYCGPHEGDLNENRRPSRLNTPVVNEEVNLINGPSQIMKTSNSALRPLTYEMLLNAPSQEQKQMLGERIFPLVHNWYPEKAGKVTGMLLEIESGILLNLLQEEGALKEKVEEARLVLDEHERIHSRTGQTPSAT